MMKVTEILETINKLLKELEKTDKAQQEEIDRYYDAYKGLTLKEKIEKKKENIEAEAEHMKRIEEYQKIITNDKIKLKLLQNNAKIALFNEVMPIVLEVFQKYEGKSYGVKTKEKIEKEIKEKTNCYVYIISNYEQFFSIVPLDKGLTYNVKCGTKYINGVKKSLLIDNKIQPVSMEDLEVFYINPTYFDDLDKTVEELKRLHAEARKKQDELMKVCSQFNELSVEGIVNLNYTDNIYSYII